MAPQSVSNRLFWAPPSANSISITPSGTKWANSAWVTAITSTPGAIVVVALSIQVDQAAIYAPFEIDIGTGAAASEVVVTTFRGDYEKTYYTSPGIVYFPIPLDNIANATRVAVRLRKGNTNTTAWTVAIGYYIKPITGTLLVTAKPQKCVPSAADPQLLAVSGTDGANSAWTQMIASTAAALVLVGIAVDVTGFPTTWQIDIGTGGSGSEVVITTLEFTLSSGGADGPNVIPLFTPLDNIPISTRVSARVRKYPAASRNIWLSLLYIEKPL